MWKYKNRNGAGFGAVQSMKIGSKREFFNNEKIKEKKCAIEDCNDIFKTQSRNRKYCLKHSVHRLNNVGIFSRKKKNENL